MSSPRSSTESVEILLRDRITVLQNDKEALDREVLKARDALSSLQDQLSQKDNLIANMKDQASVQIETVKASFNDATLNLKSQFSDEINDLKEQLSHAEDELKSRSSVIQQLESEVDTKDRLLSQLEVELTKKIEEVKSLRQSHVKLEDDLASLKVLTQRQEQELKKAYDLQRELGEKMLIIEKSKVDLAEKLSSKEVMISQLTEQLQSHRNQEEVTKLHKKRMSQLSAHLLAAETENIKHEQLRKKYDSLKERFEDQVQVNKALTSRKRGLKRQVQALQDSLGLKDYEIQRLNSAIVLLDSRMNDCRVGVHLLQALPPTKSHAGSPSFRLSHKRTPPQSYSDVDSDNAAQVDDLSDRFEGDDESKGESTHSLRSRNIRCEKGRKSTSEDSKTRLKTLNGFNPPHSTTRALTGGVIGEDEALSKCESNEPSCSSDGVSMRYQLHHSGPISRKHAVGKSVEASLEDSVSCLERLQSIESL